MDHFWGDTIFVGNNDRLQDDQTKLSITLNTESHEKVVFAHHSHHGSFVICQWLLQVKREETGGKGYRYSPSRRH